MQIIINRIALIMHSPQRAQRLKWVVGFLLGIISVGVSCVWIPAHLQISSTFVTANNIWDRIEKVLFGLVDGSLNLYFIYLIKSKLIANGLQKYQTLYRFNLGMIVISLSLDVRPAPLHSSM